MASQRTYISQKVNKIRWKPDPFNNSHTFVTGSWDEEQNSIKLWEFRENELGDIIPVPISEIFQSGDVTEAMFLDTDHFVSSTSAGSVSFYKICYGKSKVGIEEKISWQNIHRFKGDETCSCTSLANYENDIVSVGEDGTINLLTVTSESVVRKYENADSCSLRCVIFLKHNEILTSNLAGRMKIWDLRSKSQKPTSEFSVNGSTCAPTALTYHPTQRHLVLAGDEGGSITIWDLRQSTHPINSIRAHRNAISEVKFHPDDPNHLFTSSISGDLYHLTIKQKPETNFGMMEVEGESGVSNVWLSTSYAFKNKLEGVAIIDNARQPINSFDINQLRLVSSCDNGAIYLINELKLYNL